MAASEDVARLVEAGLLLMDDQRAEQAEAVMRAALRLSPEDPDIHDLLSRTLLMQGRWLEAWPDYEHRATRRSIRATRELPYPEWDGTPLAGRSILVWGEQGLGDEVMLARFFRQLRALGASRISLACHPLNVRLFEQQLGLDLVFSHTSETPIAVPRHHVWSLMFSLPGRLRLTPEALDGAPYLSLSPAHRGGVGLVERGNPKNPVDSQRSLAEGLLQRAIPHGRVLQPGGDMLDSAVQVGGLDLLITVDTSWAHLAGALGVPCWLLLPHRALDWRWLRQRPDTPWYRSLRLFRRGRDEDWAAVVARVAAAANEAAAG